LLLLVCALPARRSAADGIFDDLDADQTPPTKTPSDGKSTAQPSPRQLSTPMGAAPTTSPAGDHQGEARQKAAAAVELALTQLGAAEIDGNSRADASPTVIAAQAQYVRAQDHLNGLPSDATREEKASAALSVKSAAARLEQTKRAFLDSDPKIRDAKSALQSARLDLDRLGWVDLLDSVNPTENAISGDWAFEGNVLAVNVQKRTERATIHFPPDLPNGYRLHVEFERSGGLGGPFFMLPIGEEEVLLEIDRGVGNGRCSGLSSIRGQDASENESRAKGPLITSGIAHSLDITVNTDELSADVSVDFDGKSLVRWTGQKSLLTRVGFFDFPKPHHLGIAVWNNVVKFRAVKFRSLLPDQLPLGNDVKAPVVQQSADSVIFVCSCTGSMVNKIAQVKIELSRAVQSLKPTRSFNIVFYQDQKVLKLDPTMIPANPENKRKAEIWMGNLVTSGTADPVPALTFALQSRPSLIYFLADHGGAADNTALHIAQTLHKLNADHKTKVNTILLAQNEQEREDNKEFESSMRAIAGDTGGVFKCVGTDQP